MVSILDLRHERGGGRGRRPAGLRQPCEVRGCKRPTNERKPYCIEHISLLPYVQRILKESKERDDEEARAARRRTWRSVDPGGSRAKEIVQLLSVKGAQSKKRLAITVEVGVEALESYLRALEREGLVATMTLGSRRGTPRSVVDLTEKAKRTVLATEFE